MSGGQTAQAWSLSSYCLKKWSTQDNICIMTCYYQSQPGLRGYRQRLHAFWREKGLFQVWEQRLCDQVWKIQKKGWLPQLQLEKIRRLVEKTLVLSPKEFFVNPWYLLKNLRKYEWLCLLVSLHCWKFFFVFELIKLTNNNSGTF